MIRAFRRLSDTWLFKGILVLAILSFVSLWGVGGVELFFSPSGKAAVTMDGAEITGAEVLQEFEWETNKYRKIMPMGFSYQDALRYGLLQESLYNAIYKKVMAQVAKDNNIIIPDSIVLEYIRTNPEFMDENRQFKRSIFLQVLADSGLSEVDFIKLAQADIIDGYILDTNRIFPVAPKSMVELISKQRNSIRDAVVVNINTEKMKLSEPVSEDEILGFYEENQDIFMTPEYRDFTVATISYDDIMNNINIPDEELKAIFEQEKDTLNTPENRYIYGLIFDAKDEAKANEAVAELKSGKKDFKKIAMEKLLQFENEYEWGFVAEDFLIEELKTPVFTAKKNAIIGPIKTIDNKLYVLKVTEIKPFKEAVFKDKKTELVKRIQKERADELVYSIIENIESDIDINTPINEIAKKHNLKTTNYKKQTLENKELNFTILDTAFAMENEELSGVMDYNDGLFIIKMNSITEPKLKSISEVQKQIKNILTTQQKQDIATALLKEVMETAKNEGIIKSLKNKKLNYQTIKAIKLEDEKKNNLSKQDITRLFALTKGEAFYNQTASGYTIVGLSNIQNSKKEMNNIKKSEVINNIEDSIIKSIEQQFYMNYAYDLKVKTHDKVIEDTFKSLLKQE